MCGLCEPFTISPPTVSQNVLRWRVQPTAQAPDVCTALWLTLANLHCTWALGGIISHVGAFCFVLEWATHVCFWDHHLYQAVQHCHRERGVSRLPGLA